MAESICIILRRAPYGSVDAAEAVRHALGGVSEEMDTRLVLFDSGVHAALKAQDASGTEYDSIGEGIGDCVDMDVKVYADKSSLREERLEEADLLEGVKVISGSEASDIVGGADKVMIF
ncbi:MAG: DsrE family protein [Nitrospirota bacterium]|jgi:sulfur relay (sulfurtransferase) DsrF/TusC family protein